MRLICCAFALSLGCLLAADAVPPPPADDAQKAAEWFALLGSVVPTEREAAEKNLLDCGEAVVPALRRACDNSTDPDKEARLDRMLKLLTRERRLGESLAALDSEKWEQVQAALEFLVQVPGERTGAALANKAKEGGGKSQGAVLAKVTAKVRKDLAEQHAAAEKAILQQPNTAEVQAELLSKNRAFRDQYVKELVGLAQMELEKLQAAKAK